MFRLIAVAGLALVALTACASPPAPGVDQPRPEIRTLLDDPQLGAGGLVLAAAELMHERAGDSSQADRIEMVVRLQAAETALGRYDEISEDWPNTSLILARGALLEAADPIVRDRLGTVFRAAATGSFGIGDVVNEVYRVGLGRAVLEDVALLAARVESGAITKDQAMAKIRERFADRVAAITTIVEAVR
jgi:hypothetical protein